jgi:mitogen-activated protein kinase 1/3
LPKRSKQSWEKLFPNIKPTAADLLTKMLTFNPDKRYAVEECLAHPYFDGLHDEEQEVISKKGFDWGWDNFKPTKDLLQNMVYDESLVFHPETQP